MLLVMIGIIKVDFDRNSGFILYLRKSLFTNHSVRITIHIIEKISFWAYRPISRFEPPVKRWLRHFFKSIAGKKNKMQVFTHELVNDLGKEIKEMIFTRELLDKLG